MDRRRSPAVAAWPKGRQGRPEVRPGYVTDWGGSTGPYVRDGEGSRADQPDLHGCWLAPGRLLSRSERRLCARLSARSSHGPLTVSPSVTAVDRPVRIGQDDGAVSAVVIEHSRTVLM